MRRGVHPVKSLPSAIGLESAGVIDAVGREVRGLSVGDRVAYAGMPEGSYAELRIVPVARVIPLPADVDERTAAAMMIRGMTARCLLTETYKVQPGDAILIHAAAGGVGLIMCQWAKHLGATVIGTVSTEAKAEIARAHGCDHPIVYTREDFAARARDITGGEGVPVVYDSVGKATFEASLKCLRRRGVMASLRRSLGRSRSHAAAEARRARLDLPHASERLELYRHSRRASRRRARPVRDGRQRQEQDCNQPDLSVARRAARPRRYRIAQDHRLDRTDRLRCDEKPAWRRVQCPVASAANFAGSAGASFPRQTTCMSGRSSRRS